MANLVDFETAAAKLGLSPEELTQLRSQNEIFGYRDGASWKFKETELQRFASVRGIELRDPGLAPPAEEPALASTEGLSPVDADLDELVDVPEPDAKSDDFLELSLDDNEPPLDVNGAENEPPVESILVSEEELGESDPNASSTIIGQSDTEDENSDLLVGHNKSSVTGDGEDSDLDVNADTVVTTEEEIAAELDDSPADAGLHVAQPGATHGEGSGAELDLVEGQDSSLESSGSELSLAADSSVQSPGEGSELTLSPESSDISSESGSELSLTATADATGISIDGGGDDLFINLDGDGGDDVLILDDSQVDLDAGATNLNLGGGSDLGINLSDVDIDVSAGGSDITLNAGDSGINLMSPSDSGISLELPPVGLNGSDIEALELGEAEEIDLEIADEADFDLGDDLKSDDDFLLTPVDGEELEEESDSGSQVIALDADEYEDADMLADDAGIVEEDAGLAGTPEAAAMAGGAPLGGAPTIGPAAAQSNFTAFDVILLFLPVLPLAVTGMMLVDLIRSIWSWNEAYTVNSAIMDTIIGMFGG